MIKRLKIKEVNIDGEQIFIKKGFFGWGTVFPLRVNEKIVWKNLIAGGNWWNLIFIAIIVVVVLGSIWEYSTVLKLANECLADNRLFSITH